ncbi:MAG: hypothetical protein JJT81_11510 [Rubellimicrobium sp.]|nr:hypothetical protein [Rubellimicrobium sp.]
MCFLSSARAFARRGRPIGAVLGLALCMLSVPSGTKAQQTIVIGNDRGGLVGERTRQIEAIRASGHRVEIRGAMCYSACTLYLGAGNVCVSPQTVFGFHGPTRNGQPLPPEAFDHWTRIMAQYYNATLEQWFMSYARYAGQNDVHRLSGNQLIQLGYRAC